MKPVKKDQEMRRKAMEACKVRVRENPESRYDADALAKTDICRGRLAQKELWVAAYYINQGNPAAARQRLEKVIKEVPRTLVTPETLFRLGEGYQGDGKTEEAQRMFRQGAEEYPYTHWGKRAAQRRHTLTS